MLGQVVECEGLKTLSAVVLMPSPPTSKSRPRNYDELSDGVIVLGSAHGPKAFLQVVVSGEAGRRSTLVKWSRRSQRISARGGGGRPDMAQAGGGHPDGLWRRSRCRRPYVRS